MNFKCDGLDLSDAVSRVLKATSTKTTSPILEGIKLEAKQNTVTLMATDLEISIKKSIKADIKEEGEIVVPGRFFSEYIRKLDKETLTLSVENEKLKIKYADSEGFIQTMQVKEFPFISDIDGDNSFSVEGQNLKNIINKTIFAVATDDSRPILKGILLEIDNNKLKAVALDGYRLAISTTEIIDCSFNKKIIIPARSLSEVSKMISEMEENVKISISNNYIKFVIKDTIITSRLIDGEFINYNQIIQSNFTTNVTISREQLLNAIDRASILSKIDRNNLVKFDIKEKCLTLTSNSEIGNIVENITANLEGEDMIIAFNSKYFSDAIKSNDDEYLKLKFTNPINPCIISSCEDNTNENMCLILPVRIL